jgi:hypothetical protein
MPVLLAVAADMAAAATVAVFIESETLLRFTGEGDREEVKLDIDESISPDFDFEFVSAIILCI